LNAIGNPRTDPVNTTFAFIFILDEFVISLFLNKPLLLIDGEENNPCKNSL
jgi:hypothetical protein